MRWRRKKRWRKEKRWKRKRKEKKTTKTFSPSTTIPLLQKKIPLSSNCPKSACSPPIIPFLPTNKRTTHTTPFSPSIPPGETFPHSFSFIPSFSLIANASMSVTLVCGARNAGKSVYCRALLNSILNHHEKVAFLDIDVGQGDGTPEGYLSLSLLSTPQFRGSTVCHINRHLFRFV